jgi:NTE family protein
MSPENQLSPRKRIGLALGGGGARGLCHIEFCRALDELGQRPDVIAGTSIGAIVGAFYAGGMSGAEMAELSDHMGLMRYTRMLDLSFKKRAGLIKGRNVMDFLDEHLPRKTFKGLKIPLKIVATDLWRREQVVFSSGRLVPAIRASISVPGIFEPVVMKDRVLIDGGAVNPLPMSLIREECDVLIAVDITGTAGGDPPKRTSLSIFDSLMLWTQIMESSLIRMASKRSRPEILIQPRLQGIKILDFHKDREIRQSVKQDVERLKREIEKLISS